MKVVAVVGFSGSGKTRLVVQLIRELKGRGLRVSALKRCSHDFSLDTDGKDAAPSARPGPTAWPVSQEGWADRQGGGRPDVARLATRLFPDADVVLVEGGDVRDPQISLRPRLRDAPEPPRSPRRRRGPATSEAPAPVWPTTFRG
jgi:molybdopterin-guanine dinucleotide biosynthesis protein B